MPSMPTTSDSFGDLHSVSDGSEGVTKRQLVDKQLPKLDVAGSNPVARSWKYNGLNGLMHTGPRGTSRPDAFSGQVAQDSPQASTHRQPLH